MTLQGVIFAPLPLRSPRRSISPQRCRQRAAMPVEFARPLDISQMDFKSYA